MITFINDCHIEDTLASEIRRQIIDNFHRSYEITEYNKSNSNFSYCNGCFGCWVRNPGICDIKDLSNEISKNIVMCDILIVLTKITYGGYSSFIKKVFDRNIINRIPIYIEYKGRVQLKDRYNKYPLIITIGYSDNLLEEERELFLKYTCNKAGNVKTPLSINFIIEKEHEIFSVINEIKRNL